MPKLPIVVAALAIAIAIAIAAPASAASPDKDVLAALELWKHAMMKKDRAAFEKVLHPDLVYGHSSGAVETKAEAIAHVLGSKAIWAEVSFADTRVRVHGDTALVTGKVDYQQRTPGKDGVTVIKLAVLSVWKKGPAGWQMLARQATRPGG